MTTSIAAGPHFEDLTPGQVFDDLPALTLSDGRAAVHQAVVGDRLRLALDDELARRVVGRGPLAHPALVWDTAIGQSTTVTHHVRANLFYRGLVLHRLPSIGDTMRTRAEVVGLRQNRARAGRAATGLAALRITTRDQCDRVVLDFVRCAMLPLRDPYGVTGCDDDLDAVAVPAAMAPDSLLEGWDLAAYGAHPATSSLSGLAVGDVVEVGGGDLVSGAAELARLTLNVASVHHDAGAAGGRRLVYGGHTIGIALAQAARALPGMVTVAAWHGCDHLNPVHEGDTLHSRVAVERIEPLPGSPAALVHLRSRVGTVGTAGTGRQSDDDPVVTTRQVLDWRFVAVMV